jgi:hypothetical protein
LKKLSFISSHLKAIKAKKLERSGLQARLPMPVYVPNGQKLALVFLSPTISTAPGEIQILLIKPYF